MCQFIPSPPNPFSHLVGLHQRGIAFDVSGIGYSSAEQVPLECRLAVAVYPSCQPHLGTPGSVLFIFGSCGEQIDVAETVVLGIHGIHAVNECLHLSAHLIIINRCCPTDHIGIQYFLHDGRHIIPEHTCARLLATQATNAELYLLPPEGNLLYRMARCLGTFGKLLSQHVAV